MMVGVEGVSPEGEQNKVADNAIRTVVGIGVIIILNELSTVTDEELPILTVKELMDKPETGRIAGQRGIVQETIQYVDSGPEDQQSTLMGAIAEEVIGKDGVDMLGHQFHQATFAEGSSEISLQTLDGSRCDIKVVVFSGKRGDLLHKVGSEVEDKRWMRVKTLFQESNTRDTSREIVQFAVDRKLLSSALEQYRLGKTEPVFRNKLEPRNGPDITNVRM